MKAFSRDTSHHSTQGAAIEAARGTVLSLAVISQMETAQKLPLKSPAATTLRDWLRQDMESIWEKFQKQNARKQGVLPLGHESGELEIDEILTVGNAFTG